MMQPVRIVMSAVLCAAGASHAQSVKDAYAQDGHGVILRGTPGEAGTCDLCWRNGTWTPALAIAECNPDISPLPARKPTAAIPPPAARVGQFLVTGHADRIGRVASNERLSRARAESLSRRDLIARLAPNRRVKIEIRGSAK